MRQLRALTIGIRAAFLTPDWIERSSPEELVASTQLEHLAGGRPPGPPLEARTARHAAWLTLRLLARLRPGRWKTSCLYRSAAECLALRGLGVPARVVLGVSRYPNDSIGAHAWLETPASGIFADERYARLHRAADHEPGRM